MVEKNILIENILSIIISPVWNENLIDIRLETSVNTKTNYPIISDIESNKIKSVKMIFEFEDD